MSRQTIMAEAKYWDGIVGDTLHFYPLGSRCN